MHRRLPESLPTEVHCKQHIQHMLKGCQTNLSDWSFMPVAAFQFSSGGPSGSGGGGGGFGGGSSFERPGLGAPARSGKMRPGDELPDDCKLYVGNLSPNITDDTLKAMMSPFGNVLHAVVLLDMVTQQSRGYGFIHMDNAQSAASAAQALSG